MDADLVPHIEAGFHEIQGRRDTMEDMHTLIVDLKALVPSAPEHAAFFAIYDGHGGIETARMCREELHHRIIGRPEFREGRIEEAIREAFSEQDQVIIRHCNMHKWMNGSTGVVVLLIRRRLFVANVGDSEASLVSREDDGSLITRVLTTTHRASDPEERARIEALGGHVFFNRVFGSLAVSRSFGDSRFKVPRSLHNFVTCDPMIATFDLDRTAQYLVLACDGLWDVMDHTEVAAFVRVQHLSGQGAQDIARKLVDEALNKRTEDNVTALVIIFTWPEDGGGTRAEVGDSDRE